LIKSGHEQQKKKRRKRRDISRDHLLGEIRRKAGEVQGVKLAEGKKNSLILSMSGKGEVGFKLSLNPKKKRKNKGILISKGECTGRDMSQEGKRPPRDSYRAGFGGQGKQMLMIVPREDPGRRLSQGGR